MALTVTNYPTLDDLVTRALNFYRRHLVLNGVDPVSAKAAVQKGDDAGHGHGR